MAKGLRSRHKSMKCSKRLWTTDGVSQGAYSGGNPMGIGLIVHDSKIAPPYAGFLQQSFGSVGLSIGGIERSDVPVGTVQLVVGNKP